jgi:hypothetical protein
MRIIEEPALDSDARHGERRFRNEELLSARDTTMPDVLTDSVTCERTKTASEVCWMKACFSR